MPAEASLPHQPNLEDLKAQDSLLDSVKTANALTLSQPIGLEERSISDKVRFGLSLGEGQQAALSVTASPLYDKNMQQAGEMIAVSVETEDGAGAHFQSIPVARVFEGTILPIPGFTDEEAQAVNGMAENLRTMKDEGYLPDLGVTLEFIDNPYYGQMKVPGIDASHLPFNPDAPYNYQDSDFDN